MAQQLLINHLRSDKIKNRIRGLIQNNSALSKEQVNKYLYQLENAGKPTISGYGCYTSAQCKEKIQFISDFERKNRNMASVIHKNKIYDIYYGISGRDSRLFVTCSEKQRDSRISASSIKRFLSNNDFYITWYYCGELTDIECLYIESNMSLYQHQKDLASTCLNKVMKC